MADVAELWAKAVEQLRPPLDIPLTTCIEANIKLPQRLAAEPGAVKLWPPQREIANSIGNADVERVTWLKAVRSGYTFLLTAAVARYLTAQARSSKKRR
jgi:phage terminase large subunit GpA-like protein